MQSEKKPPDFDRCGSDLEKLAALSRGSVDGVENPFSQGLFKQGGETLSDVLVAKAQSLSGRAVVVADVPVLVSEPRAEWGMECDEGAERFADSAAGDARGGLAAGQLAEGGGDMDDDLWGRRHIG